MFLLYSSRWDSPGWSEVTGLLELEAVPRTSRPTAVTCWSTYTTCTSTTTVTPACWCVRSVRLPTCSTSRYWHAKKWSRLPTPYSPGWPWPTYWSWSSTFRSPIICTSGPPTIHVLTASPTTGLCSFYFIRTFHKHFTPYPYGWRSP